MVASAVPPGTEFDYSVALLAQARPEIVLEPFPALNEVSASLKRDLELRLAMSDRARVLLRAFRDMYPSCAFAFETRGDSLRVRIRLPGCRWWTGFPAPREVQLWVCENVLAVRPLDPATLQWTALVTFLAPYAIEVAT